MIVVVLISACSGDELNRNSSNDAIIKAALTAGLYPNVVRAVLPKATFTKVEAGAVQNDHEARQIRFFPKEPGRVFLHPSSTLFEETRLRARNRMFLLCHLTSGVGTSMSISCT